MKGLVIKDLFIIKRNFTKIFIFMIFMSLLCVKQINILAFIFPFYTITMCLSTLSYDDYNKWYGYAITFPMGKKQIILSKYVMTLIIVLIVSILTFLLTIILSSICGQLDFAKSLESICSSIVCSSFVISFMYPIFIKFGSEKGRIVTFILVFALCAVFGTLFNIIDKKPLLLFMDSFGIYIIAVFAIVSMIISYFISLHVFQKKDY